MAEQIFVAAVEVEPGNYIPGMDNVKVQEIFYDHDFADSFGDRLGDSDIVMMTYKDKAGKMGYLFLTPTTRIEVLRQ